jgi:DNA-binding transcriptional ArsR family regulator
LEPSPASTGRPKWHFLTNHAHVLLAIARDPGATARQIADEVGITERAVTGIVADLEQEGYVTSERVGRGKRYTVDPSRPFRHPMASHHAIGELIAILGR